MAQQSRPALVPCIHLLQVAAQQVDLLEKLVELKAVLAWEGQLKTTTLAAFRIKQTHTSTSREKWRSH